MCRSGAHCSIRRPVILVRLKNRNLRAVFLQSGLTLARRHRICALHCLVVMARLSKRALAAYAAAALPLAAAALPVYVHAPKFYSGLGLDLALIGILLLAVRVLDAVSDPLLGLLADRVPQRWGGRKAMLA